MHQDIEPMALLIVTDETTKADLEEAIVFIRQSLQRLPSHYVDRRAVLHARIDALLCDWERAK